ncbi:Pyruvate dehydrogenase phosphatase regulatory [Trichuris trichiura]|uniref:Pyruvate dehydrogenase phosphatase regulatory n=1 Tax=Trichuris trichiura TaxID=36087 RepID=A0A077YZR5_TRITR|nr:Pyruvate dehydrogenase phosphatase regulatory [Trichuris trichiura]
MVSDADVVIVGGGVIGTSIAYHLARRQAGRVVLLERERLGSGGTSHADGLLTYYHYIAPSFKRLVAYSLDLYGGLKCDEHEGSCFQRCGTLRLATTSNCVDEFKRYLSRSESRAEMFTPAEVKDKWPLVDVSKIKGALYTSCDGFVNAPLLCRVLASMATKEGALLYEHCPSLRNTYAGDGHWNVETADGCIRTANIVIAAGLDGKQSVKATLQYELPLLYVLHQHLKTRSSALLNDVSLPVIEHPTGSYYIRQDGTRLIFGAFEKENYVRMLDDWSVRQPMSGDFLQPNFEIIKEQYDGACDLLPPLREMGVEGNWSEALCMTPDGFPLVGPLLTNENYWIALGFADNLSYAGGIGKYLADWIVDGEPPFELSEAEPGRFEDWSDSRFRIAKTKESYSMHYSQSETLAERPAGRPTARVSGIFGALISNGAHMQLVSGWENPTYFGAERRECVAKEYRLATQACGVIDLSSLSMIEIRGSSAHQFLQYMTVKDVPEVSEVSYSCLLTSKGRMVSQVKIIPHAQREKLFLLVSASDQEPINVRWLTFHALREKFPVEVANVSQFLASMSLVGPLSRNVLSRLTKSSVTEEDFPHMTSKQLRIASVPVIVCHTSQTEKSLCFEGELGYEMYHNRADTLRIYEEVMKEGQRYGIGDIGWDAVNVLRMEKGIKWPGLEVRKAGTILGFVTFCNDL